MQILCSDSAKLDTSFYNRNNVTLIAKELLGKILVTRFDDTLTAARITETEAYNGVVQIKLRMHTTEGAPTEPK